MTKVWKEKKLIWKVLVCGFEGTEKFTVSYLAVFLLLKIMAIKDEIKKVRPEI